MAPATLLPLATFLLHSPPSVPDSSKTNPKYLNSTKISYSNYSSSFSTTILLLPGVTFRFLLLHTSTKTTHHCPCVILKLATQNHVIYIQETRQSPLSTLLVKSHSPLPHHCFHLFHFCIRIHIEKPRGNDTPMSHTTIDSETIILTYCTLT